MRILVTNDDGIRAEGIRVLAELALSYGEVTVVAPKEQCSGMSHRITYVQPLMIEKEDFPVEGVSEAYSVDGTPADCVKAALEYVFKDRKPDIVFSGINDGFNVGTEILYSGTVGAAMEALVYGLPALAFSIDMNYEYGAIRHYFKEVMDEVLRNEPEPGKIWNLNFPGISAEEVKGIRYGRTPADKPYYHDYFEIVEKEEGRASLKAVFTDVGVAPDSAPEGSDIEALIEGYISVGTLGTIVG